MFDKGLGVEFGLDELELVPRIGPGELPGKLTRDRPSELVQRTPRAGHAERLAPDSSDSVHVAGTREELQGDRVIQLVGIRVVPVDDQPGPELIGG